MMVDLKMKLRKPYTLDGINKKIEAIKAERALAEQNYTTAKEELQSKSTAGAELLEVLDWVGCGLP